MRIKQALEWGNTNPNKLFQIDGFGAMLSIILLVGVLAQFECLFGIPESTLYFLALFPCLFTIYDFYCFYNVGENVGAFLKGIAIFNFTYCFLSIGLAIYHAQKITSLGWGYILIEVSIICCLAIFELKIAKKHFQ